MPGLICDRTFSSIADFAHKNMHVPKFLASAATWLFGLNLNTRQAFEEFEGNKRSIYYTCDKVIKYATLSPTEAEKKLADSSVGGKHVSTS